MWWRVLRRAITSYCIWPIINALNLAERVNLEERLFSWLGRWQFK